MLYAEGKLIMSLSSKKLDLDIVNLEVPIKLMTVNKEKEKLIFQTSPRCGI